MSPTGGDWYQGPSHHVGGYSSWGNRVGATLLRGVMILPAYVPAFIGGAMSESSAGAAAVLILVGIVLALTVTIRGYIQRGHLGADFGDAVVGQALVREQTDAPMGSGLAIFGRGLVHILDGLPCYLGYLWPLWDDKSQTFADKILTTVVVARPCRHAAGDLFRNTYEFWKPVLKT